MARQRKDAESRRSAGGSAGKSRAADSANSGAGAGRFSYDGLDRVIHEKARLGILASLAAHADGLLFNDLKELCALTDGNLSRHLSVLSKAGLVEIWRGQQGPRQQTMYRLTAEGRARFTEYISVLEGVVSDAQQKAGQRATRSAASWKPA
jgi:DNA-binding MarR family transcriptional regulator